MLNTSLRRFSWTIIGCILVASLISKSTPIVVGHDFVPADAASDAQIAAEITCTALSDVKNLLRQSYDRPITQLEVTNHIDYVMRAEGSDGPLSYPTVIMARDEWAKPYGGSNDDDEHIVNPNSEPVMVVKAGAKYNGQSCDIGRTFIFESATQEMKDAYSTVLSTEKLVIAAITPGARVSTISAIVESGLINYTSRSDVIYSYYWGHGIGSFTVEDPILSNDSAVAELVEGQILSIQIYLYFDDGWLVRVEDMVAVTDIGVSVLSTAPKELSDVTILNNSTLVTVDIDVADYEYGSEVSVNATIHDSSNGTLSSISFHNGNSWRTMNKLTDTIYTLNYILDYNYPSFVPSLVRVTLDGSIFYFGKELYAEIEQSYIQEFEPHIRVVIENSPIDTLMSWVFTKIGAEMLRVHFYNVYPPPGDQFLIRDGQGRVIFEYKWELGAEAMSPWVPGNTLYVDVVPHWQSIYGGVNHFYFTIDEMGVIDTEYVPPTSTTSEPTTQQTTTTYSTTIPRTTSLNEFDTVLVSAGGVLCLSVGLLVVYLKKRN